MATRTFGASSIEELKQISATSSVLNDNDIAMVRDGNFIRFYIYRIYVTEPPDDNCTISPPITPDDSDPSIHPSTIVAPIINNVVSNNSRWHLLNNSVFSDGVDIYSMDSSIRTKKIISKFSTLDITINSTDIAITVGSSFIETPKQLKITNVGDSPFVITSNIINENLNAQYVGDILSTNKFDYTNIIDITCLNQFTSIPKTTTGLSSSLLVDGSTISTTGRDNELITRGFLRKVILTDGLSHSSLSNLTTGNPHTQYIMKDNTTQPTNFTAGNIIATATLKGYSPTLGQMNASLREDTPYSDNTTGGANYAGGLAYWDNTAKIYKTISNMKYCPSNQILYVTNLTVTGNFVDMNP